MEPNNFLCNLMLAQILDISSTALCVGFKYGVETNPIPYIIGFPMFFLMKLGLTVSIAYGFTRTHRNLIIDLQFKHLRFLELSMDAIVILSLLPGINNIILLVRSAF